VRTRQPSSELRQALLERWPRAAETTRVRIARIDAFARSGVAGGEFGRDEASATAATIEDLLEALGRDVAGDAERPGVVAPDALLELTAQLTALITDDHEA
jgi:hypothetical protein